MKTSRVLCGRIYIYIPITSDKLLVAIFIWHFHVKFSSNNIPRSLKYFTCSTCFPFIDSFNSYFIIIIIIINKAYTPRI